MNRRHELGRQCQTHDLPDIVGGHHAGYVQQVGKVDRQRCLADPARPPDENQRLVEVSPRPPDLVALRIVHAVPFPEQAGDEHLQFPVRYVTAPAVYQLGLDVPGDFERLVRRQAGSLDRVGQHFPGEGPAADGNVHGPRFPENEVANQLVLVMGGEQLPDDAGDLLLVDIRFLAQGGAHIIRQLISLIVIEAELNQVMHEHSPHEGNAPLAVDYSRHTAARIARNCRVKYSYVVVCGKYTSTSAGRARSVPCSTRMLAARLGA